MTTYKQQTNPIFPGNHVLLVAEILRTHENNYVEIELAGSRFLIYRSRLSELITEADRCIGYLTRNTEEKKEEEQDEPFKVTHNTNAKQFEVIAITPDMTPMYIIPYSTAINAHKNYRIEAARARAEAECYRLNEEWKNKPTN